LSNIYIIYFESAKSALSTVFQESSPSRSLFFLL